MKKRGLRRKIEDFLASYKGKVLLNFAYSWGAAVVILGTLFKLTHLPGADVMLFIGMGTEVLVFFISAFDRPFKSYKWESVFPSLKVAGSEHNKKESSDNEDNEEKNAAEAAFAQMQQSMGMTGGGVAGGPIIIGGGGHIAGVSGAAATAGVSSIPAQEGHVAGQSMQGQGGSGAPIIIGGNGMASVTPGVEVSPEMEEATKAYLEQLKGMTDALNSFVEQTKTLGQDAEQINVLNKNLSGINAIYEIQLRNISTQLGTIDEINLQTKRMAQQIDELNQVYARMLEAMTVNMKQ